jgi:hypothetical protein
MENFGQFFAKMSVFSLQDAQLQLQNSEAHASMAAS